jgi:hypothetical protein
VNIDTSVNIDIALFLPLILLRMMLSPLLRFSSEPD